MIIVIYHVRSDGGSIASVQCYNATAIALHCKIGFCKSENTAEVLSFDSHTVGFHPLIQELQL